MAQQAKLYVALASLCQIRNTLRDKPQFDDRTREQLHHVEDEIDRLVKTHLPSGSGFDSGTQMAETETPHNLLTFQTDFHHLNEHGYYTHWSHHMIRVTPSFTGIVVKVGGRNDKNDIKGYIEEQFYYALEDDVSYSVIPASWHQPQAEEKTA